MNIPDKWKNELNSLSQKDYITLTKAILFDLPEPQISENNQYIADRIYEGFKKTEYNKIAKRKSRKSNGSQFDVNLTSNGSQTEVNLTSSKEEKREASPPCSPSSFPPHPLINSPYNPPLEEKREEALTGAGACEDEQIPFEGFEPLDPPESEVKRRKPTIAERFEALWAEYPKKQGKKNAFESYQRALKEGATDEVIADGIKRYKDYIASRPDGKKYTLDGSTYFYQKRWEDEYDTSTADGKDANGKPAWMSQEDWEEMNAVFG